MENLELLRTRVETAEDLHSVVRTMKALAAVTIRQYREAVASVRTYGETLELGFQILLRSYPDQSIGARDTGEGHVGLTVFGSDQGMCGPFNERMAEFLMNERPELLSDTNTTPLISIGHRLSAHLTMNGVAVERTFGLPGSVSEITSAVDRLLLHVDQWQRELAISRIDVSYHRLLSGSRYEPRSRQVLPIDAAWLDALRARSWSSRRLPQHTMSRDELLTQLVRQYVFIELFRAYAESLASENASRLASMQAAERNIEERIDELRRQYHALRQQSITQELLDIVSGYLATTEG